jgi:hypothetical protein
MENAQYKFTKTITIVCFDELFNYYKAILKRCNVKEQSVKIDNKDFKEIITLTFESGYFFILIDHPNNKTNLIFRTTDEKLFIEFLNQNKY